MKTCKEIMTAMPDCGIPSDSVDYIAEIMNRDNIGSVPIVEDNISNRLVGIVTDRDLAMKIIAEGNPKSMSIDNIMSRDPLACREEDDVELAMKVMADNQVRRIPIIDENGAVVGIIAQGDVAVRMNEPLKTGQIIKEISKPEHATRSA